MKILMLGDYSNLHACLAKELRKRGHEITLVSDRGGYMKTEADVELRRSSSFLGGARYLYRIMASLPSWTGYDVVQIINPVFLSLKPDKLRIIYDILRKNNRSIFLTLCGNDHFFVKDCVDSDLFRFSEFRIGKEKAPLSLCNPIRETGWLTAEHARYTTHLYDTINGAMSVLPEYDMSARRHMDPSKLIFTNLPIEIEQLDFSEINPGYPIKILIGMRGNMEIQKGTAKMLDICRELEKDMPDKLKVTVVRNLSLSDYLEQLRQSHIVIDQLYSYSPATNALQTMALGRITASGAQPEFYHYIDEDTRPIFLLSPLEDERTIKKRLQDLILEPDKMKSMMLEGRKLVEKHNDVRSIAPLFEAHWNNNLQH